MKLKYLYVILIILSINLIQIRTLSRTDNNNKNDYDDTSMNDDYSANDDSSKSTTISSDYYDSLDNQDENSHNNEEDNESFLDEDEEFDENSNNDQNNQPYECPSQCKCVFNKRDSNVAILNDENSEESKNEDDYYDDTNSSRNLNKRFASSNQTVDYEDDYASDETNTKQNERSPHSHSTQNNKRRARYDIYVDCSSQNLNTISYLFSDEFPLDQIVSFNLSNNKFRLLKLDDGFEDLVNLHVLDLSSNNYLKSLSPRNFLKKFRHLEKIYFNNLNQINCDLRPNLNILIPIDCKWFRTLLYLYKRNITVVIERPNRCDLNVLVNSATLISRCFRDFHDSYRLTDSNQTLLQADNSNYEFRIEPELNQILIEGDTLELTCKLKKLNIFKKYRNTKTNQNFYRSQIKWYLNDNQQLMISTIYYTKDSPTQIQIIENKSKYKQDDQIESKLIITNTLSTQHTGRYTCVASLYLTDKRLNLNTSKIEIKVLSRHQLNILESNPQNSNNDLLKSKQFCPEIITQTYKGIYKWPRTLSNSKITQKCAFNSNSSSNRNDFAIFECLSDGKWSDYMELGDCHFESNLTRYLSQLTNNPNIQINLEDFIKKIVSIQSNSNNDNSTSKASLNMYDIIFIQKFLLNILESNRSSYLASSAWKHEFLFLNDILSRLNEFFIKQAQLIESNTFSNYFFNSLFEVILSNLESKTQTINQFDIDNSEQSDNLSKSNEADLLSSYLATLSISPNLKLKNSTNLKNSLICKLEKYQVTQQIYFKCEESLDRLSPFRLKLKKRTSSNLQTRIDLNPYMINDYLFNSKKLQFVLFENDKLFPLATNQSLTPVNLSNYELINLVDHNRLLDSDELTVSYDKSCSQILGILSSPNPSNNNYFNLTLEIKIPDKYYTILSLIKTKLNKKMNELLAENIQLNKTKFKTRVEKDHNLFDQIFSFNSLTETTNSLYLDLSNGQTNNVLLVNKNLILNGGSESFDEKLKIYEKYFLLNPNRLKQFKNLLLNTWFNIKNYEILYGQINKKSNQTQIEWSTNSINSGCKLNNLATNFNESFLNSSLNYNIENDASVDKFRLFARLNCNLTLKNSNVKIQFLGLKNSIRSSSKSNTNLNETSLKLIIDMIDKYALMHRLNINDDSNMTKSFMNKINSILIDNYELFDYKIIYFSSITSSILLLINIFVYIIFNKNLLMPRSFYHVIINSWISVLLLILLYTLGINQIFISHLCLITGVSVHYLVLCSFVWYLLYFWCLYSKLDILEKRNFNLIYNKNKCDQITSVFTLKKNCSEYNGIDEDDSDDYIQKPVVHLYMLGWGVPLLLICIIVSITKRDYIQTPFSYCFTNEPNLLIGSILVPICLIALFQLIFVGLIWITLRKIVKDLKDDDVLEPNDNNIEDKRELCKNWVNNKIDDQVNDLKVNDVIEIKMNPQTQKSLIINASKFNDSNSYDASNTSISNSDSDRTSVMDTQHKPQIQLKFSLLSWFLFVLICILACVLTSMSNFGLLLDNFNLITKILSYLLSIVMLVYSILQISFYVLSRDDILMFRFNFSLKYFSNLKKTKIENNPSDNCTESNNDLNNDNNWYFEPKNDSPQNLSTEAKNIQDPYEQSQGIYERYELKSDENHHVDINDTNQIKAENFTNLEESSDDNENDHKKSISDVIFSSKKLSAEGIKSPSNISIKSSSSSSAVMSSEATSTNNVIKSFKIDEDDGKSESVATQTGLYPTLAIQEDISEYISTPLNSETTMISKKPTHTRNPSILSGSNAQTLQLINNDSNIYESSINRSVKRNTSNQSKKPPYVFVDYTYEEALPPETFNLSKNLSNQTNKLEIRQEDIIIQEFIENANVGTVKNKLDDLLANSCLAQTGTAIESIACLVRTTKSTLPNTTGTIQTSNSSNSSNSLNNKPKSRSRSNGSVTSSLVSSSNDSNVNTGNYIENAYDETHYQIYSNISNRSSQVSSNGVNNNLFPTVIQPIQQHYYQSQQRQNRQRSINPAVAVRQSSSTLPSGSRIYPKTLNTKNGSLLRNNHLLRPKELEIKHETSV